MNQSRRLKDAKAFFIFLFDKINVVNVVPVVIVVVEKGLCEAEKEGPRIIP